MHASLSHPYIPIYALEREGCDGSLHEGKHEIGDIESLPCAFVLPILNEECFGSIGFHSPCNPYFHDGFGLLPTSSKIYGLWH